MRFKMTECGTSVLRLLSLAFVLHLLLRVEMVIANSAILNAMKAAEAIEEKHRSNCASTRRVKRHDHARFPQSPPIGSQFGKALRFFGGEVVRFTGAVTIPSHQFTIDFWMKPEGGQASPVTVIGLFDDCSPESKEGGWEIGLQEASAERSLRVFFRLQTQRSHHDNILFSSRSVEPNVWVHVAATFSGKEMKLYINQAKVGVSSEQKGHIFADGFDVCEHLEAGGDRSSEVFYRGLIDEVRLWSVAKSHKEISTNVFAPIMGVEPYLDVHLEMYESFAGTEELNRNPKATWVVVTANKKEPEITKSTIPGDAHDLSIVKPPCGSTVCDNPEIIRSYVKNTHLRGKKVVHYRVVNIWDDDGTNPMVTKKQMKTQHDQLNEAFKHYNITFELKELNIRNTSLRRRTVTYMCEAGKIGDGMCNSEHCRHEITGNDGGDCDEYQTRCDPKKRGNGVCDRECNKHYNAWDLGDCCNKSVTDVYKTCFDPNSPNRAYMSDREYKTLVNLNNQHFLNVYLAQWSNDNLQGVATFPWEKTVHSIYGGTILGLKNFGRKLHSNALVHEFGHVLGLWHVHHGVTEMDCSDDCFETFPSLELGDLCSDTNPTPANNLCRDPTVNKATMTCGVKKFMNTPFSNYMSYANDSCTDTFTEQQVARMHCYVDLMYQSWQGTKTPPSFIPLPPRVTSKAENSVKLAWIPPLGTGGGNAINGCHECREDRVFQQYAITAESPNPVKPNGYWAPHQAIGAPDAEPCNMTPVGWTPFTPYTMDHCEDCYIEFGFKEAVIPTSLTLWVIWASKDGISNIQLIFTDGSEQSLGNATAQCDAPLTMTLRVRKRVSKVRVSVRNPSTVIDAIQMTSSVNHPNCLMCEPVEYLVTRKPAFPTGKSERVKTTRFEDRYLEPGKPYTYTVQAVTSLGVKGPPSPPLTPEQGFCGNGIVEYSIGEECDDGNVRDSDGCNMQCKKEDVFHCTGHPSLCYRHEGDGICEEFEKKTNIKDCGFYTPEGFEDQWAVNVTVNSNFRDERCPESVVLGPPPLDLVCQSSSDESHAWSPCKYTDNNYWLEVTFNRSVVPAAVVLYVGSDGKTSYSPLDKTVKVELIDKTGRFIPAGNKETKLSCKTNPIVIPVLHDMTEPFFYVGKVRVSFKSYLISVAGVALRSRAHFDVVEMSKCKPDEVFSPRTQHCHKYTCERPSCPEPLVKHGTVKCEGTEEGQTCMVTCRPGYRPLKPFKMICFNKDWEGINTSCVPVSCGVPRIPHGKADCPHGLTFGKKCSLRCIPGAKMSGGEGSVTCEEDGKWSAQSAFCVMTCPNPEIPEHSVPLAESNCIGSKRTFSPGVSCKFRCKPGYRVKDREDPGRRILKKRCTKSGWWTRPRCEPIVCPELTANLLMWYNCSDGNSLGSVCKNNCPGEEIHQVKCEDDGQWTEPLKRCTSDKAGRCSRPEAPLGVILICEDYFPGGKCKTHCKSPGYDVVDLGNEVKWRVMIRCIRTPKLDWYPNPANLQCIPGCRKADIADGLCDPINNNKHCRWDGGDCCPSTTKNRIVRPVPIDCKSECACKDPDAKENEGPSNGGASGVDDEDDEDDGEKLEGSGSDEMSIQKQS